MSHRSRAQDDRLVGCCPSLLDAGVYSGSYASQHGTELLVQDLMHVIARPEHLMREHDGTMAVDVRTSFASFDGEVTTEGALSTSWRKW
jgi:hypothetical protein